MSDGVWRILAWVNGCCIVVLLGAGLAAVFLVEEDEEHPSDWDPRVLDLVRYVERERGHSYKHPVDVDFLTPEEYSEETRTDPEAITDEEREEIEEGEGLLRALGLISGSTDLLGEVNELTDTGTLAFYDSEEERVVVRGTEVDAALRVTLVHELTHVLQDQIFDLDRYNEEDENVTSGQLLAFRGLVEGDADRIEAEYFDSLDGDEQDEIEESQEGGAEELEEADVAQALQAMFAAPYILGDTFVAFLEAVDDDEIDKAFRTPPATEEHLLDPFAFLEGQPARSVDPPGTDGLDVVDEGDFGAMSLLVVLAERIDLVQALTAATGWGGDAYTVFERDGRTCVRIHVTGDSPSDTDELDAALRAWSQAAPAGSTTHSRTGDVVRLESCDAGSASTAGSGRAFDALQLAGGRTGIAAAGLEEGVDREVARCVSGALVVELTPDELQDEEPSRRVERISDDILERCGAD